METHAQRTPDIKENKPASAAQEAPPPQALEPGPLFRWAAAYLPRLQEAVDLLDLDLLDQVARRYARVPASGSEQALHALAVLGRLAPDLVQGAEVNLQPDRLLSLADRGRALGLLELPLRRVHDHVADSLLEHGDEVVELISVGCARAERLRAGPLADDPTVRWALGVLRAYQERVVTEGAHRSKEDKKVKKKAPRRRKKKD